MPNYWAGAWFSHMQPKWPWSVKREQDLLSYCYPMRQREQKVIAMKLAIVMFYFRAVQRILQRRDNLITPIYLLS
jgi:hypothetical protein